jgi:hypothetical protein
VVTKSDFKIGIGLPIPKGSVGTVVGVNPNSINREYVWVVRWDNIKREEDFQQGCCGPNLDASECSWVSGELIEKSYNFINQRVELGTELAPAGGWAGAVSVDSEYEIRFLTNEDISLGPEENLFAARGKVSVEDSDIDNLSKVEFFKF